ncbi:MAG: hypothetical protein FWH33_09815 [Oscillospiraceae bacterium]|nr:hypothetical protein [Oscillospiraceae bacterium]
MEYVPSMLVGTLFILVSVICFVYSRIDRHKMHADIYIRKMKPYLDIWLHKVVELMEQPGIDEEMTSKLKTSTDKYFGYKKKKDYLKTIPLVNEISDLLATDYDNDIVRSMVLRYGEGKIDIDRLIVYRDEYNRCKAALDKLLNRRLLGLVGKLLRTKRLAPLSIEIL